ncbi:peptidoglycan-binding protein [Candidatus Kaiserbacteria bacterium]|nr:peptidoglycan-binding protein [Candidatus Kaiserbacteria bacterium]
MRYFSYFTVRFSALALGVLLLAPLFAFAQTGYGGGGGGGGSIYGPGGYIPAFTPALPLPQGLVLGASAFNFTRTLSRGMVGEDVVELQKILIAEGYLDIPEPSGYFGPQTEEAVRAYQEAHGLEPVGIVGPLTRALLNAGSTLNTPQIPLMFPTTQTNTPLLQQLQLQLLGLLSQLSTLLGQR